jgi:hypothetical protein
MKAMIFAAAVSLAALAAPASADTLTTPLLGGNNQSGVMFDVVVGANGVTFQSLGVNVNSGTFDFEFYTIDGGIGANTSNPGAWTLRDTFTGVVSAGVGNLTSFNISDFAGAAGSTIGFYITSTLPFNNVVQYTNGTAVGDVVATDGALSILSGYGKSYPFGSDFAPRNFNGSITYDAGLVPEPATWAMMIGGIGAAGGALRRRKAAKVSFA